jgi:hypothetical protein
MRKAPTEPLVSRLLQRQRVWWRDGSFAANFPATIPSTVKVEQPVATAVVSETDLL